MGWTSPRHWRGPVLRLMAGSILAVALVALCWALPASTTGSLPSASRARKSPARPSLTPTPTPAATNVEVVGLGDSVMAGTQCGCDGIPNALAKDLKTRDAVSTHATNLGQAGYRTGDVLDDLTNDRGTRSEVAKADVVVLIIGANDLNGALNSWQSGGCDASCYSPAVTAMKARLHSALAKIAQLEGDRRYWLLVDGYWNVFTDGSVAIRQGGNDQLTWSRALTAEVNAAIKAETEQAGGRYVDLTDTFADDPDLLLAEDGDHPNAEGVQAIAKANLDALPVR